MNNRKNFLVNACALSGISSSVSEFFSFRFSQTDKAYRALLLEKMNSEAISQPLLFRILPVITDY